MSPCTVANSHALLEEHMSALESKMEMTEKEPSNGQACDEAKNNNKGKFVCFVGNLRRDITEKELRTLFTNRGVHPLSIRIIISAKHKHRSYSYVDFRCREDKEKVLTWKGDDSLTESGRMVNIDWATPQSSEQFKKYKYRGRNNNKGRAKKRTVKQNERPVFSQQQHQMQDKGSASQGQKRQISPDYTGCRWSGAGDLGEILRPSPTVDLRNFEVINSSYHVRRDQESSSSRSSSSPSVIFDSSGSHIEAGQVSYVPRMGTDFVPLDRASQSSGVYLTPGSGAGNVRQHHPSIPNVQEQREPILPRFHEQYPPNMYGQYPATSPRGRQASRTPPSRSPSEVESSLASLEALKRECERKTAVLDAVLRSRATGLNCRDLNMKCSNGENMFLDFGSGNAIGNVPMNLRAMFNKQRLVEQENDRVRDECVAKMMAERVKILQMLSLRQMGNHLNQ